MTTRRTHETRFPSSAEPSNGTKYWRSIGELSDTPNFVNGWNTNFPQARRN
jgi:hypothetical protein